MDQWRSINQSDYPGKTMNYKERLERKRREREAARRRQGELARQRRQLEEAEERRLLEELDREKRKRTDHGRAQLAFDAGESFFQVQRVISADMAEWLAEQAGVLEEPDISSQSDASENLPITQTLAAIEEMGWQLVHVGYTYVGRVLGSAKMLASGEKIATMGDIVAIYLFRRGISEQETD